AAELGALSAIGARRIDLEPRVAYETRHRVLLDAECRHEPAVDHIVRRQQQSYLLSYRDDDRAIDLDQIVLALLRLVLDLLARGRKIAIERNVLAEVVVTPFPLIAGDLDGQVRARRVFHRNHGPRGGPGHAGDDEAGNHRPQDLERSVLDELAGLTS